MNATIRATAANRRRYQRFAGNGLLATLENGPSPGAIVPVKDVSRGGIALLTEWQPDPGLSLTLTIGVCFEPIRSRVVRFEDGAAMIAFGLDEMNRSAVEKALQMAARRLGLPNDPTLQLAHW
jgi:hypothetical protein